MLKAIQGFVALKVKHITHKLNTSRHFKIWISMLAKIFKMNYNTLSLIYLGINMPQPKHPADESAKSQIYHVWIPIVIGMVTLAISIYADFHYNTQTWTQRIGNLLIVLGAYISYHQLKESHKIIDSNLYINTNQWYNIVSITYIIVGTLISGYGDLFIKKLQNFIE